MRFIEKIKLRQKENKKERTTTHKDIKMSNNGSRQAKKTTNVERIAVLEKMVVRLHFEMQAILKAIEKSDESNTAAKYKK